MYGKLFSQMYDGTLGTEGPWQALITFQQMIILADKDGTVDMTPEALSRRTTVPLEIIREGIERLLKPDPHSRTPDEEGRRITMLSDNRDWGWRIVNYAKYRDIRTAEERREYHRQYAKKRRESTKVNKSTEVNRKQPIVDADVYAQAQVKEKAEKQKTSAGKPAAPTNEVWFAYATAYESRYGVPPTRNAKANGLLSHLLARLGAAEAPMVAAFYVTHPNAWYQQKGHALDCLLADAEKVRTEWATNRTITGVQARQNEKTASNPFAHLAIGQEAIGHAK